MSQRVLRAPGRTGDIGKYRERSLRGKDFPNKRKKIIIGKDLTTPLGRRNLSEAQKERYRRVLKEKINVKHNIVKTTKKGTPVGAVCLIIIFFFFLMGLICSHIVLYEREIIISQWNSEINKEQENARILERELDIKNDVNAMIGYAVNELGMVREDSLPKQYLVSSPEDDAEVVESKNSAVIDLSNILSAFSNSGR